MEARRNALLAVYGVENHKTQLPEVWGGCFSKTDDRRGNRVFHGMIFQAEQFPLFCELPGSAVTGPVTEKPADSQCDEAGVTWPGSVTPGLSQRNKLVLSTFPGADLLGRGFEAEGYCVVRSPDIIWGGDIRDFHPVPNVFEGIVGGPPCPDFSKARRTAPTGYGLEMLREYARVVTEAQPVWFLMENVPQVPTIEVPGYTIQRFNLNAKECGLKQNRLRTFQFGTRDGARLVIHRSVTESGASQIEPCCLATEGKRAGRRTWADFCELQGLPRTFDLPGLSRLAKYRAVGNGVPVPMARVIARAIASAWSVTEKPKLCACDCGRPVAGRQVTATPACRKRMERRRKGL